jgi:hypothetical protein
MSTFHLYTNAGLTVLFSGTLTVNQNIDGSSGPVDQQLWIGSTATGKTLQADSNPGVDQIVMSVTDSAPGSGNPASDVKLALTQGGLAGATGGASLNLGTTILSLVANAVTFWVRVEDSTHVVGLSTELQFTTNLTRET